MRAPRRPVVNQGGQAGRIILFATGKIKWLLVWALFEILPAIISHVQTLRLFLLRNCEALHRIHDADKRENTGTSDLQNGLPAPHPIPKRTLNGTPFYALRGSVCGAKRISHACSEPSYYRSRLPFYSDRRLIFRLLHLLRRRTLEAPASARRQR